MPGRGAARKPRPQRGVRRLVPPHSRRWHDGFMRPIVGLGLLVGVSFACSGGRSIAVTPASIEVSPDRRTVTVVTFYPTSFNCGHLPGGLEVDLSEGVAVITAKMKSESDSGDCDALCASVTQTVTLPEPLPRDVRFAAPPDADPGCGDTDLLVTASTTPSSYPVATPPQS
jgi:hypothetical protein